MHGDRGAECGRVGRCGQPVAVGGSRRQQCAGQCTRQAGTTECAPGVASATAVLVTHGAGLD
ncbi:hypothetical protein BC831DRAFT_455170 [Entophlyctis helioformis]|nr:hypothetical protein BC831DRAFT_455170 [Entophlyctis helioformis]